MHTVKLLLKYKVDLNVADNVSTVLKFAPYPYNTCIQSICFFFFFFFYFCLLTIGVFQEGWTPLHVAVQSRNRDIVKVLLLNGADKNRRNKVTL